MVRKLLFNCVKHAFAQRVLQKVSSDLAQPTVAIDRLQINSRTIKEHIHDDGQPSSQRSMSLSSPPDFHTILTKTVFGVSFSQLQQTAPKFFRKKKPSGTDPHFCLKINFKGEHVQGDSGPYRQFFSDIAQELRSDALPFIVPCPNALTGAAENRDKFVLAPSRCSSVLDLAMLKYLGILMGMAIRSSVVLPLDLSSFFWKQLIGESVSLHDIRAIDQSIDGLNAIRLSDSSLWEGDTRIFYETFECTLSDGSRVPLCPGGKNILVTYETRIEYCSLVETQRLKEIQDGVAAILEGLTLVIPSALLTLFTWEELSWKICGKPFIDVDLLRRHTKYGNVPVSVLAPGNRVAR